MSPAKITFRRTFSRLLSQVSAAFAVACFWAVAAVLFAFNLQAQEGSSLSLPVIWAMSVAPLLPIFAALVAMETWSEERQSGRIDLLLSVAVRERDLVLGKFFGVWVLVAVTVVAHWVVALAFLWALAPGVLSSVTASSFLPALFGLLLQAAAWSAFSSLASAAFRHSAAAAAASVLALSVLPRALWWALMSCSGEGRTAFGELPFDAHAVDMASGLMPIGPIVAYLVLTLLLLFMTSKSVARFRFQGRGARALRLSTGLTLLLSAATMGAVAWTAARVETVFECPAASRPLAISPRTRGILAETGGRLSATCFLSRNDARFRHVTQILRAMKRVSDSIGGVRLDLRFVDPSWDLGAAERLVSRGIKAESVVFEKKHRLVSVSLRDGFDERVCAAALCRVSAPVRTRRIYWTCGHGEMRFDDYGAFGLSDLARDLVNEGFVNGTLDLAADGKIPGDCALVIVAGAKDGFSRAEIDRLESYLREGGRLLVLLRSVEDDGIAALLTAWGIRPTAFSARGVKTLSGTDVIVSDFADHPISASLVGSRIVLERPVAFTPSAAAETGTGVDRIGYSSVAEISGTTLVAAIERGGRMGSDLALRPTRVVAIGDPGLVMNGQLAARACANRDFFLNCVAYLSGTDAFGAGDEAAAARMSGMDRDTRLRHLLGSGLLVPGLVFVLLTAVARRKRSRT